MAAGSLMIVQGGGPTAVFNATLVAAVREAQQHADLGRIYGARFGMQGLAANDIVELTSLAPGTLQQVHNSPGAALGSSRFKPTEEDLDRCVSNLRKLDVRSMIFIGGNGTMAGAQKFREFCSQRSYEVRVMGAAKTIDNDICGSDRCPGFGSAARFVAQTTVDLAMDLRSLSQPVSIFETLGRDVGWLSAAALLGKKDHDDAPHVVCVPEVPFVLDEFLARIDATVSRIGWALAVVSEGTCYADGTPVFEQVLSSGEKPPLRPLIGGVAQHLSGLLSEHLGLRCRSEKPGLIGRSAMPYRSTQDVLDAELTGRECVRALLAGHTDAMVSLRPLSHGEGDAFELLPLNVAAGPRRCLPAEWLSHDGLAANDSFLNYLSPIVGPLNQSYPNWSTRTGL